MGLCKGLKVEYESKKGSSKKKRSKVDPLKQKTIK